MTDGYDLAARTNLQEMAWLPVWDVSTEALATYWLTPICSYAGQDAPGYDASWFQSRLHLGADYLALDLANIKRVVEEAEKCNAAGVHCLVSYSVHATTLQRQTSREVYLAELNKTPSLLRTHIVGYIAEIDSGTPVTTIADWVRSLRFASSQITIQLHESESALELLSLTGASAASFSIPPLQDQRQTREYYARQIQRWAVKLRRQNMMMRLDNANEPGLLMSAIASGVDFITSQRCWPGVAGPFGIKRFTRHQLGMITW